MYKIALPMQQSGYSVSENASGIETVVKIGFARRSADLEDASLIVSVTWKVSKANYMYLRDLFTVGTENGKLPFLIDLIIDNDNLVEYTANFSSEGISLIKVVGLNYFVKATLEVVPLAVDEDFDNAIVAIGNASNFNSIEYLNLFNQIVNVNWPHT